MMSKKWVRRAVAAPKANSGRTGNRFSPRFVELEQRDVPAVYYVDSALAGSTPGSTVTWNDGNPGQTTGTFGTNVFATLSDAYAKTTGDATADTINIAYGSYDVDNTGGTIVITAADGALSLVGSGAGATTITPMAGTVDEFGPNAAVFRADGAGAVLNVSNLNFDGGYPAITVGQGFRYEGGATGTISKVTASLAIFTPIQNNSGTIVVALGTGTNVTVTGSTFTDYGATGIGVDSGATATITGNTFNGGGPGAYVIYGVQVSNGSSAQISGNTFTSHLGQFNGAPSAAILLSGDDGSGTTFNAANATIIGNRMSNNVVGVIVGTPDINNLVADPSNATIQHNNILSNDTGVLTDTTAVVDARFNWWGDTTGPLANGNNTAAGNNPTGLGNPVDEQVLYRDATITPNATLLQGPTPVTTAASSAAYRNSLTRANVTVSGPAAPVQTKALVFTVQFDQVVFDFTAADITVTNGTVSSLVDNGGGKYTVTVARTLADNVSVSIGASTLDANNLPTIRTVLFGGTNASNTATAAFAFTRGFAAGGDAGTAQPYFGVDQNYASKSGIVPFETTFTGGIRTATADLNGDGVLDIVVGSGPGRQNRVRIYDGATTALIADFSAFESSFTGGVFVTTGDVNGDGTPEVVVTPDVTGGPRVRIHSGAAINTQKLAFTGTQASDIVADFFGIQDPNFFGGARAAIGDMNADGFGDVMVAAGFGGGPRVAGFSGNGITSATQVKLFNDFFAFPDPALRDGAYIAGGDLNGDGFADMIAGSGDGGAPRVTSYSGKALLTNTQTVLANFFSGSVTGGINNRGGIRVAAEDIDLDGRADIITSPGRNGGSIIGVFLGSNPNLIGGVGGILNADQTLNLFGGFTNGAFVG